MSPKTCFVICPIGDANSPARKRSDQVLRYIISPAVLKCGYSEENLQRADRLANPGIITSQIVEYLLNADLVIADLTDHNPNVFYELAIRHAVRKPIVQLIQIGQKIPFDVSQMRTIEFNLADPDDLQESAMALVKQIEVAQKNPSEADNPISSAIDIQNLKASGDPTAKANAEILTVLKSMSAEIAELKQRREPMITYVPGNYLGEGLGGLGLPQPMTFKLDPKLYRQAFGNVMPKPDPSDSDLPTKPKSKDKK